MVSTIQARQTPFHEWLARLIESGESVLCGPPSTWVWQQEPIDQVLTQYHLADGWDLGGPPLELDAPAARWAARLLAEACWSLLGGDLDRFAQEMPIPTPPNASAVAYASTVQSVDLCLRFLPQVHNRARFRPDGQPLIQRLETALAPWPLSAVLCRPLGQPAASLAFLDHPGLLRRYAERLAEHPRADWIPPNGPARQWVEWVFAEKGIRWPESTDPDLADPRA